MIIVRIQNQAPVKRCLITRDTSVTKRIYDAFTAEQVMVFGQSIQR